MSSPSHPRHRSPAFMPLGIKAISCESTFSDFGTADFGRAEVDAAIGAAVSRHCFDFFYGGGQRSSYSLRGGSCREELGIITAMPRHIRSSRAGSYLLR